MEAKPVRLGDGRLLSYAEYGDPRGVRGFAWEVSMLARPWGFSLGAVACPVHLWHGEEDASTPMSMARHIAIELPDCRPTFYPNEGHFVAARYWDEIVSTSIAPTGAGDPGS